jgi:molybdate transport system substrate-binding protein
VSAAASLQRAFTQYEGQLGAPTRFSFAGSDELAAQIREGIKPDLFASANTSLPETLYAAGLVEKPVVFAGNKLVLAVPAGSTRIARFGDVERPGVTLAVGTSTVPVGAYTIKALERLSPPLRNAVLANIRDREPNVTGIVGKLVEGAVDAGFLYATDVVATNGRLKAIELPASVQPQVAYGIVVVKGTKHRALARTFIAGLLAGVGKQDLIGDGFLPAPAR